MPEHQLHGPLGRVGHDAGRPIRSGRASKPTTWRLRAAHTGSTRSRVAGDVEHPSAAEVAPVRPAARHEVRNRCSARGLAPPRRPIASVVRKPEPTVELERMEPERMPPRGRGLRRPSACAGCVQRPDGPRRAAGCAAAGCDALVVAHTRPARPPSQQCRSCRRAARAAPLTPAPRDRRASCTPGARSGRSCGDVIGDGAGSTRLLARALGDVRRELLRLWIRPRRARS